MSMSIETVAALGQADQELLFLKRNFTILEDQIKVIRKPLDLCEISLQEKQQLSEEFAKKHLEFQQTLKTEDDFIVKVEAQVPLIRTQKEFLAGKKQVEEARKRRGIVEDELLENDINQEENEAKIKQLTEDLEETKEEYEIAIEQLLKDKKTTGQKIDSLEKNHKELFSALDESIAKFYERSQERGLTPIIVPVIDKACRGCNTLLQPQLVNEMIVHPNEHRNCPFCYRIIYYQPEPEAESSEKTSK